MWIHAVLQNLPLWCYVVLGAALGALARYTITLYVVGGWLGIAVVNVVGCLFFGILYGFCLKRGLQLNTHPLALLGLTGFCGGFTTFSSYVFNLDTLLQQGQFGVLILNTLGQHVLGSVDILI
jgi:fluoride exporter